jgi:hypothetical protein
VTSAGIPSSLHENEFFISLSAIIDLGTDTRSTETEFFLLFTVKDHREVKRTETCRLCKPAYTMHTFPNLLLKICELYLLNSSPPELETLWSDRLLRLSLSSLKLCNLQHLNSSSPHTI